MTRGPTSTSRLELDWDYPVYDPQADVEAGRSLAAGLRFALPVEKAFAVLAGDDPRPLLVLRECLECSGTDDALLSRTEDNEKTLLMARWFHCVKLPPDVLRAEHPFRGVFEGDDPPHLFVCDREGRNKVPLNGAQSRRELWQVMHELLSAEYKRDASRSLADLFRILDKYDLIDAKLEQLRERLDRAVETAGTDPAKLRKIRVAIVEYEEQRRKLRTHESEVSELELRRPLSPGEPEGS